MIQWTTKLNGYPSESVAFVLAGEQPYALFLSWRIDNAGWRAFLIPNARTQRDLFGGEQTRWSIDLFAEGGLLFRENQIGEAQGALVRLLAGRLDVKVADIKPARNGRPVLTKAQVAQIARTQPAKRR